MSSEQSFPLSPLERTDTRTLAERIASLRSERVDLVRQMRRSIHTSRDDGCNRRIAKIDKILAELEASADER